MYKKLNTSIAINHKIDNFTLRMTEGIHSKDEQIYEPVVPLNYRAEIQLWYVIVS